MFYVYDDKKRLMSEVKAVIKDRMVGLYPNAGYIWGSDKVLAKLDNLIGKSYYYIYNGHGDVVQIVDTDGNIVNRYDYDPWGNFLLKDETIQNPFTYFCQTYDESTGLYYLRARYFDPTIGRFTQEDTHWNTSNMIYGDNNNSVPDITAIVQSSNLYVYCGNNPIMLIDPLGLEPSPLEAALMAEHIYNDFSGKMGYEYIK